MKKEYNVEINYIHFHNEVVIIGWSANIGFGQLTIYRSNEDEDKFYFDTECLSDDFRNEVLSKVGEYLITHSTKNEKEIKEQMGD